MSGYVGRPSKLPPKREEPWAAAAQQQVKGLSRVLVDVVSERRRQDVKWGEQNHADGTGPDVVWAPEGMILDAAETAVWARERCLEKAVELDVTWRDIALEEFAEALAEDDEEKLRAELIQSIAVLVNWVEAIDRRRDGELVRAVADSGSADSPGVAEAAVPAVEGSEQRDRGSASTADVAPAVDLYEKLAERDPGCVERWPECTVGGYDPRCCRFPKSCSCWAEEGL